MLSFLWFIFAQGCFYLCPTWIFPSKKGYHLLEITHKRRFVSRDVTFRETIFLFSQTPSQPSIPPHPSPSSHDVFDPLPTKIPSTVSPLLGYVTPATQIPTNYIIIQIKCFAGTKLKIKKQWAEAKKNTLNIL